MHRADIGTWVRNRLLQNPQAMKIPAQGLDIFVVRDFLTQKECDALVDRIDADRQPSTVLGQFPDPDYRTSDSCNMDPYDPTVKAIEAKITDLMGINPTQGETIQGQRYAVGQQFKAHHDFFHPTEPYWDDMQKSGGQRTWTAMMFLNDVEAGGHTFFPNAGVKISPRKGNLLTWNNMDELGEPNHQSLHQGMPVESGVKYIITKWYREGVWAMQAA
jgi:prolyl 4-hydroxylase